MLTPAQVFRKFVTDGVSESGTHEPVKSEIVQLLERIEQSSSAGIVVRQTKAALDAVTPDDENAGGWVLNDSTATNNGYYYRSAGAWVKGRGFPDTFAAITLAGTANAQTGTVGSGVNPADIEVYYAVVTTTNTGPMTLSISGEVARDVVNAAGNALSAGEWTGVVLFFLNDDGDYQLLIDAGAAAAAAQSATDAAASKAAAELARDEAVAAASGVQSEQPSAAFASANYHPVSAPDFIRAAGYAAAGDDGEALYAKSGTATGDLVITLADGVTDVGFNIQRKTWRPAMRGIFSSASDQKAAINEFIADAAAAEATVEWGPLDLTVDAHSGAQASRGIVVPSNSQWVMHPSTRFRALANSADNYETLNLWDVSNVRIWGCGAKILGERSAHTGVTGEWGMGVSIRGCTDVYIEDLSADDCWGDGWYIGTTTAEYNQDIQLIRPRGDNNRRNNFSLISAIGLLMQDYEFSNANGTAPQTGIDIEPNDPTDRLQDIWLVRGKTSGNTSYGVTAYTNGLAGTVYPMSITIDGHEDDGSLAGMALTLNQAQEGFLRVVDPVWRNSDTNGLQIRRKIATSPKIYVDRPLIIDPNRVGSVSQSTGAAVLMTILSSDAETAAMGGVHINELALKLNSGDCTQLVYFDDSRASPSAWEDISFVNPRETEGKLLRVFHNGTNYGNLTVRDPESKIVKTLTDATQTIAANEIASIYRTPAVTADRTFTLYSRIQFDTDITFIPGGGGFTSMLALPASNTFLPSGEAQLGSSEKGARLKVRRVSATEWEILEKIGTWSDIL